MKVALVSARNMQATGVDRYASSLAAALTAAGASVDVVELRRRELSIGRMRIGGLASLWWQRLRAPQGERDILHAADPSAATRGADVVTVHDLIPETHPEWASPSIGARLDWRLSRRNAKRARQLIAISAATRDEILRRWNVPEERVSVVHQGVDHDQFRPTPGALPWLAADKPNLVYVGDDNPRKNVPLMVRALAVLREEHGVDARLIRAGPTRHAAQAEEYRAFAREWKLDLVEPGYVGDAELPTLYTGAACFLWPTRAEGFGLPPLEAMACGAPVVALDTAVNREVVGSTGRYHADEPAAAAEAIAQTLARPPARDALLAHAAFFTWARTAERTLAAYARAGSASR